MDHCQDQKCFVNRGDSPVARGSVAKSWPGWCSVPPLFWLPRSRVLYPSVSFILLFLSFLPLSVHVSPDLVLFPLPQGPFLDEGGGPDSMVSPGVLSGDGRGGSLPSPMLWRVCRGPSPPEPRVVEMQMGPGASSPGDHGDHMAPSSGSHCHVSLWGVWARCIPLRLCVRVGVGSLLGAHDAPCNSPW